MLEADVVLSIKMCILITGQDCWRIWPLSPAPPCNPISFLFSPLSFSDFPPFCYREGSFGDGKENSNDS